MKTLDLAKPAALHERPRPWRDNLDAWFDRLLTSPAVYRWTVSNPLTRWITRRRAQQVFDLMAGFVHTQVLLACVRLRILELVCESPRTLGELAAKCQVPALADEGVNDRHKEVVHPVRHEGEPAVQHVVVDL